MVNKSDTTYENNPFFIGLNGLKLFFAKAQTVAMYAVVLAVAGFITNTITNTIDLVNTLGMSEAELKANDIAANAAVRDFFAQDASRLAVSGVLIASAIFISIVIWLLLFGVLEYTGAKIALNKKVGFKEAFRNVGSELAAYIWLYLLIFVKVFLWSLLFIIPGIVMAVRYTLAGTVFFAEGKRGNDAIKRSVELTNGAWFTTFAGVGFWNLITLGQMGNVLTPGTAAVLYRQFRDVTDAGKQKPAAHWLSWATLFVPPALVLLLLGFVLLVVIVALMLGATAP